MYFAKCPKGRAAANAAFVLILVLVAMIFALATPSRGAESQQNNVVLMTAAGDTFAPKQNSVIVGVKLINPTVAKYYKLRYKDGSGQILWQTSVNAVTTSETLSRPVPTDTVKIRVDPKGVYWDAEAAASVVLYLEQ